MEFTFCCNSIHDTGMIATKFCTCHDSTAVVACAKFCSNHFIKVLVIVKGNFHQIWITSKKSLVKYAPGKYSPSDCSTNLSFNSLTPGRCGWNLQFVIFNQVLVIGTKLSSYIYIYSAGPHKWHVIYIGSGNGMVPSWVQPCHNGMTWGQMS